MKRIVGTLAVVFFIAFVGLGTWQLKRRVWKLDLISRVEQRVHAPVMEAPRPGAWAAVSAASDEYRHVSVTGSFADASQTLVQAVTDLGAGYWVLTALVQSDGSTVLVNRGFVGADDRGRVRPAGAGAAKVSGLLRVTEPGGGFLRHNDPAGEHWYSRDVQAIAVKRQLSHVAPYFIDADATSAVGTGTGVPPVGGLTVIRFRNSHLVYAVTWYTLALLAAAGIWLGIRSETGAPRPGRQRPGF